VFWINLPVGLAAVLLAARVVPESKDDHVRAGRTCWGAALLAASVGLVALALVKAPGWGWGSAGFIGLLVASVACGAAMVRARGGTTRRSSSSGCSTPGPSAARSPPRSCTTPGSAPSC
jgi:hypothetical protein